MRRAIVAAALLCAQHAVAQEPIAQDSLSQASLSQDSLSQDSLSLALPIDCKLGASCWVANYVDVDPGPGAADFRCGPRSYQDHEGVDFAIRDRAEMARGVTVLASAAGTVKNIRDGVADAGLPDEAARKRVTGRECGNGVLIEHAGGWQTQYCHLRNGSIKVAPGQAVEAGTPLGLVGMSGLSEFPHVHLTVRKTGKVLDPFTGSPAQSGCGDGSGPLWALPVPYETVALYNAGFAGSVPDPVAIRRGERQTGPIPADAQAIMLWVDMFGVLIGDSVELRITRPDGSTLMDSTQLVARTQAQKFIFVGDRRANDPSWKTGTWIGEVIHRRNLRGNVATTTVRVEQEVR